MFGAEIRNKASSRAAYRRLLCKIRVRPGTHNALLGKGISNYPTEILTSDSSVCLTAPMFDAD